MQAQMAFGHFIVSLIGIGVGIKMISRPKITVIITVFGKMTYVSTNAIHKRFLTNDCSIILHKINQ